MPRLSIEDLLKHSADYDHFHGITQDDVEKANMFYQRIINSRNPDKPMPGDIMICQGPEKIYQNGHIAYENLSIPAAICVEPYIPFVNLNIYKRTQVIVDTSGGYWFSIPEHRLSKIKSAQSREKLFKAWGHCGAAPNGAFTFSCPVNVWSYFSETIY